MKKIIFFILFLSSFSIHTQWVIQPSGITNSLRSVVFYYSGYYNNGYFPNLGFAVGLGGKILRSTNGGLLWTPVSSGTTQDLYSVSFGQVFDSLNVIACGANGTILRSTNAGISWVQSVSGTTSSLRSISYNGAIVGRVYFAAGDNGVIMNSANGIGWERDTSGSTAQLNSTVYFYNSTSGFRTYACGNSGTMLKSVDYVSDFNYTFAVDTNFHSTDNLLGMTYTYNPLIYYNGVIFVSTEGGKIFKTRINQYTIVTPWTQFNSGVTVPLRSMAAYRSKVWAVGDNGNIRVSADTGNTWTGQTGFTTSNLYGIFMLDSIHGWIVGDNGAISNTLNGGGPIGIQKISSEVPSGFSLSQNYPNPFNPTTNIHFAIPKSSFVKLVVYDMQGREIETIVNENLKAGIYNAGWDASGFASGVYFYKLISADYSQTKKMIVLK